jgi:hypothetical protein
MVFFENNRCLKCESQLGFLPDLLDLSVLEPLADGNGRRVHRAHKKTLIENAPMTNSIKPATGWSR